MVCDWATCGSEGENRGNNRYGAGRGAGATLNVHWSHIQEFQIY
jgi:hypothetical protein